MKNKAQDSLQLVAANWAADADRIRPIRHQVFIEEQGVSEADEWDEEDASATHLLAIWENRDVVGTARLQSNGKIGRMAVLPNWRAKGIGAAMLMRLVELAVEKAISKPWLYAQEGAIGFYERFGFVTTGKPFMEAGIVHREMRLERKC